MKSAFAGSMLFSIALAELSGVTITTAPQSVQSALVSYISNWDHHTLGVNKTVGGVIASVYAVSAANPTAANAILNVRSHVNFMSGPTPLFMDLENPSSVLSSISAQIPTTAPYPAALGIVSDLYAYLGSVASSEINGATTIPPPPATWTLNTVETEPAAPVTAYGSSSASSAASVVATSTATSSSPVATYTTGGAAKQDARAVSASMALAVLFCAGVFAL